MKVKVLLFASFKEQLECSEVWVDNLPKAATMVDLCQVLVSKGERWSAVFSQPEATLKIAINQEMAEMGSELAEHDEVAFFPPVTGG